MPSLPSVRVAHDRAWRRDVCLVESSIRPYTPAVVEGHSNSVVSWQILESDGLGAKRTPFQASPHPPMKHSHTHHRPGQTQQRRPHNAHHANRAHPSPRKLRPASAPRPSPRGGTGRGRTMRPAAAWHQHGGLAVMAFDATRPVSSYTPAELSRLSIHHLRELLEEQGVCSGELPRFELHHPGRDSSPQPECALA